MGENEGILKDKSDQMKRLSDRTLDALRTQLQALRPEKAGLAQWATLLAVYRSSWKQALPIYMFLHTSFDLCIHTGRLKQTAPDVNLGGSLPSQSSFRFFFFFSFSLPFRFFFFFTRRHPVLFVGFRDHVSLTMVTLDTSGLLCVWPYGAEAFSGFGWYTPSKVGHAHLKVAHFAAASTHT